MRPLAFALVLALAACGVREPEPLPPTGPPIETAADSLAWRIVQAAGGLGAWDALDTLRFDFVVERGGEEVFRRKLLWDRAADRARVEWPVGADSVAVAMLDVAGSSPEQALGEAWVNGAAPDSAGAYLADAYGALMNDTYWLLAPLKLFDDGVNRALAPDSADATTDVLLVTFDGVGHTPGDRYWLRADRAGRLRSWTYELESGRKGHHQWTDYHTLETPAGPLRLAQRKAGRGGAIRTVLQPAPQGGDAMTSPTPVL